MVGYNFLHYVQEQYSTKNNFCQKFTIIIPHKKNRIKNAQTPYCKQVCAFKKAIIVLL